ncbi:transcriptional regulator [Clostridia bacterium]|nr:transcriptional regulator [Clostridia bacterium]
MGLPDIFKALSDPVRREILQMLRDRRMSAGEISDKFNMTGATISYHLSQLKKADLIFETKHKNFIYYELNTSVFGDVILWLIQFQGGNKNEN